LAGLVFALPILIIGLLQSNMAPLPTGGGYILEGNSLLYAGMKLLIFGQKLPHNGIDVTLNQMAWAGWVGLFVTGLNLLPVGQLDGGHLTYTLFGNRAKQLYWPILIGMVILGIVTNNLLQWGIWIALLLLMRNQHAEPLDDVTPLDPQRRALGLFCLLLFVLVFVPIPLTVIGLGGG